MSDEMHELEARIRAAYDGMDLHPTEEGLDRLRQLPSTAARPSAWKRWAVIGTAVAAGLVLVVPIRQWRSGTRLPVVGALAEATLPAEAFAQGSERPAFPVASLARSDIRPGEWVYAMLPRDSALNDSTPLLRVRVERTEYAGRAALLTLGQYKDTQGLISWGDSTWRDASSLDILARSFGVSGGARQTQEFRENEVLTGYTINGTTTWRVLPTDTVDRVNAGVMLPNDIFGLALAKAPLDAGWKGSITLLGSTEYGVAVRKWFDLSVVGEERVTVPAGVFDCWKVAFGRPRLGTGLYFWVSKDRQWLIQQAIEGEQFGKFRRVLVSGREE